MLQPHGTIRSSRWRQLGGSERTFNPIEQTPVSLGRAARLALLDRAKVPGARLPDLTRRREPLVARKPGYRRALHLTTIAIRLNVIAADLSV